MRRNQPYRVAGYIFKPGKTAAIGQFYGGYYYFATVGNNGFQVFGQGVCFYVDVDVLLWLIRS